MNVIKNIAIAANVVIMAGVVGYGIYREMGLRAERKVLADRELEKFHEQAQQVIEVPSYEAVMHLTDAHSRLAEEYSSFLDTELIHVDGLYDKIARFNTVMSEYHMTRNVALFEEARRLVEAGQRALRKAMVEHQQTA